ncbi:MAG: Gfo/Idh/MocA family oxidoreductase [Synechococcaceae cyanobacterium RL_1_2]|nr:Gfo/Idh/MocA family oxidoreductase [Synechococcaceae cyanobacterium RL_1_2]
MSDKLRIAIAGTGFGQKIHLPACQNHPSLELVGIYNRDQTKAEAIAQEHHIPQAYSDFEALVTNPHIDGITITTPPFLHYSMAKQALLAGKHLFLEKPLGMNAQQVRELYEIAKERNLVAMSNFEFRTIPTWRLLKQYLDQGFVGKIRLIKVDWLVVSRADASRPWNWYSLKAMGGGALGAIGSHAFDYIHWLFGPIAALSAHLSCAVPQRPDPTEQNQLKTVDSDDTCLISLELADGTPCQINLSSVTYQGRGHWVEVYGDRGTLVLGNNNLKDYVHGFELTATPAEGIPQTIVPPASFAYPQVFPDGRQAPVMAMFDRWVEAIKSHGSVTPSLKEGFYSQLLMDLAHLAHEEKRWVKVPPLTLD